MKKVGKLLRPVHSQESLGVKNSKIRYIEQGPTKKGNGLHGGR